MRQAPDGERCAAELLTEFVENRAHVYAVLGDIGRHRARQGMRGVDDSGSRVMADATGRRVHVTPFTVAELWQAAAGAVLVVGTIRTMQLKVGCLLRDVYGCVFGQAFDINQYPSGRLDAGDFHQ